MALPTKEERIRRKKVMLAAGIKVPNTDDSWGPWWERLWKKLLHILNRKLSYSRYNREQLQKDLYYCLLKDRSSNHFDDLYNVIHIGAYYILYDVKQYRKNEYIPYAIKYSELVKKICSQYRFRVS